MYFTGCRSDVLFYVTSNIPIRIMASKCFPCHEYVYRFDYSDIWEKSMTTLTDEHLVRNLLYKTIKKHAGLSEFDRKGIEDEVEAIMKALRKYGVDFNAIGATLR